MKQLLVLGAGLVSPPLIRYFLPRRDVRLVIASLDFSRIEPLVAEHRDRIHLVPVHITDAQAIRSLMRDAGAVISILPAPLLPTISRIALEERRPLVSTSYATAAIRELDEEAKSAGVLLLNETGFDPGIDHMTAMKTIRRLQREGSIVRKFSSAAAGLPAPEADTNPWHYKFSWSPRGVIAAARSDARFLRNGRIVEAPGRDLHRYASPYQVDDVGTLEIYPNRDSLFYQDLYGLHDATELFRGTLRYPGWMKTIAAAGKLGWLDPEVRQWPPGTTFADVSSGGRAELDGDVAGRFEWAGFFSQAPIELENASPLDIFVSRLEKLLRYEPAERDMAILQHEFEAQLPDGRRELTRSGIVVYGEPHGDSAMSQLVGLPAAIAANLILEKRFHVTGVQIPVLPEIYDPLLDELASQGVVVEERSRV